MEMSYDSNELRENKELLAEICLITLIFIFLLYLYEYKTWLEGVRQFFAWILRPEIHYTSISLDGATYAIIGIIEILMLGAFVIHLLLPDEEDLLIQWSSAIGMGVGLVALLTMLLSLLQVLYSSVLNVVVIAVILVLSALILKRGEKSSKRTINYSVMINHRTLLGTGIVIIIFFIFYNALLSPIDHFDALIYHAGMAKIMFTYHGIPLLAGPSPGIEMSANYPPLYSSLGAFFFTQMGTTETDLPLRAISPFMSLFTLLATYKLGQILLGHEKGFYASLVLATTPLFVLYSIQALNNMMATFYLVLATLHMVLTFHCQNKFRILTAGFFYGFALSTTYLALYFAFPFIVVTFLLFQRNVKEWIRTLKLFLLGVTLTGALWYVRNLIVLGNPIWPFAYQVLGGRFIDRVMIASALQSIHDVGIYVSFGKEPDILDWFYFVFFGRVGFPALSLLTAFGVILSVTSHHEIKKWTAPILAFVPIILMILSFDFFPRYLVLLLPFAAILSAQTLSYIFMSQKRIIKYLAIFMLVIMLIYPGIATAVSGKMYHDVAPWEPPQDFLWYLRNPGVDYLTDMKRGEGERVEAWSWLNANLKTGERVATYESRIYYIKDGDIRYFFFLDGWEARPLFEMSEPEQMITYLRSNSVKYVFILGIVSVGQDRLPLIRFLGSPYFPLIYQKNDAKIYNVGPLFDPILGGEIPIQINYDGWTEVRQVEGHSSRSILEGDNRPRLFVATPDTVIVTLTYLDKGEGSLMVNLFNPYTKNWIYGMATINKTNTYKWRNFTFIVPQDPNRLFVELGLHAFGSDFIISRITATRFNMEERTSYTRLAQYISNKTRPPSLMIYLPIMKGGEKVVVTTTSHRENISIEIFEGIIQPWETTKWWERHRMVARVPELPTLGTQNPTLVWKAEPGICTLVVVLWDEYSPDVRVDLSITIGGSG